MGLKIRRVGSYIIAIVSILVCASCATNGWIMSNRNNIPDPTGNTSIEEGCLSFRVDSADLIYTIPCSNPLISLHLQSLIDGEWKDTHVITIGTEEGQSFRICNFVNGPQPYYKGADGFLFRYIIVDDNVETIAIPITLKETSVFTVYNRSFNNLEFNNGEDVLLGYFIITNKRGDYSSWGPEVYESKEGITENMQVIAVKLSLN